MDSVTDIKDTMTENSDPAGVNKAVDGEEKKPPLEEKTNGNETEEEPKGVSDSGGTSTELEKPDKNESSNDPSTSDASGGINKQSKDSCSSSPDNIEKSEENKEKITDEVKPDGEKETAKAKTDEATNVEGSNTEKETESTGESIALDLKGVEVTNDGAPTIPTEAQTAATIRAPTDAVSEGPPTLEPMGQDDVKTGDMKQQIEDNHNILMAEIKDESNTSDTTIRSDDTVKAEPIEEHTSEEKGIDLSKEDFDATQALEWNNGIGTLPGSDLKFRMNEFGVMEMITDDLFGDLDDLSKDDTSDKVEEKSQGSAQLPVSNDNGTVTVKQESGSKVATLKELEHIQSDDICRCENCGMYGVASEFCRSGRFCSQSCVGVHANKMSVQAKVEAKVKHTTAVKPERVPGQVGRPPKKKRKPTSEGEVRDSKMARFSDDAVYEKKPGKKDKKWTWEKYLEQSNAVAAPHKLYAQGIPTNKNGFKVGMKLEAIDPKHPSLYCVVTVAEIMGYRVRLHFDGYSECYDFWVCASSEEIFPVGWAEENGKTLQPPKGYTVETFEWSNYIKLSRGVTAPNNLFSVTYSTPPATPHGFRAGMKLEAVDKKNTILTCVATVADVRGEHILIHFDGWEDNYDYWCDPTSPYIHPVGWCQENGKALSPPNDWPDIEGFTWEEYMEQTRSAPVSLRAFKPRPPVEWEVDMRLEAVDKRNPILIRAGRVAEKDGHQIKIHFDGWLPDYDFWVDDDSVDVFPCGWCSKTGHQLQPPFYASEVPRAAVAGQCPTLGCNGVGHVKGAKYTGHHSTFGCPYSALNMNKENILADRLGPTRTDSYEGRPIKSEANSPTDQKYAKCPTSGCNGEGHVTGRFTAHHKLSGCPIAPQNKEKLLMYQYMNGDARSSPEDLKPIEPVKIPKKRGRKKKKRDRDENEALSTLHQGIHQSVFMSTYVPPNPAKDLPLNWDQHSKLLPGLSSVTGGSAIRWSVDDVTRFVMSLPGCADVSQHFKEEQIDGEAFLLLNQTDMVKILNMKLGPAIKIYNSILMLKRTLET
ncbi:unnamed protein product [Owenia fusiformis]|uniref:Lethal(3)malignant brain tumor-like protein 1 n=1 Tax=Owenia fusiformis TaxID=6347 RepID=A0A8J1U9U6_OWEFU|nr:unnamed protein product [Owenia fusiformis]